MNPNILKQIDPDEWYKVATIMEKKWLPNTKGTMNRIYIYRLIRAGLLPAKDRSIGRKQPLYMIHGNDLQNFIKKNYL